MAGERYRLREERRTTDGRMKEYLRTFDPYQEQEDKKSQGHSRRDEKQK